MAVNVPGGQEQTAHIQRRSVTIPFIVDGPPVRDRHVFIEGNFNAVFRTANPSATSWAPSQEMILNATSNQYEITIPNLEVGQRYEYHIKIIEPGKDPQEWPDVDRNGSITVPPLATTGPSQAQRVEQERARTQVRVRDILRAATSSSGAAGLAGLMENLRLEIRNKTSGRTELLLAACSTAIANDRSFPASIREKFQGDQPQNPDEFYARWLEGAEDFRDRVRNKILADENAKHALHLHGNHFNHHAEAIVRRVCHEFDRGYMMAAMRDAFGELETEPPTNADFQARNNRLAANIQKRLKPAEPGAPPSRWAWIYNTGVQAVGWGLIGTGVGAGLGATILGAKALAHLAGLTAADVADAEAQHNPDLILERMKKQNIGKVWWKSEEGKGGKTILNRLGASLARALIPFYKAGKSFEEGGHGGHDEEDEEHGGGHEAGHADPAAAVRALCRQEVG